jgi:hypothetical protein
MRLTSPRRACRLLAAPVVLVIALAFAPGALADPILVTDPDHDYGEVNVGAPGAQHTFFVDNFGPTNPLNVSSVAIGGANAGDFSMGAHFCVGPPIMPLPVPTTCMIQVTFTPAALGARSATLTILSDDAASPTIIPLDGVGIDAAALLAPASLAFGSRAIGAGATATQQVTVTSNGTTSLSVGLVSIVPSADSSQFAIAGQTCTSAGAIAAPGTCTIDVRFDPDSVGAKTADLRIVSNGLGSPQLVPLTGTGTSSDASALPVSLSFGSQDRTAGATATQQVTVTSTGVDPVTVSGFSLVGADLGEFVIGAETCTGASPIAAPGTCTVDVSFDPTTVGGKAASLRIAGDGSSMPIDVPLSGTGTGPDGSAAPSTVPFGSRDVASGATTPLTVTFTSNGTSPVTPGAVTIIGLDPGEFTLGTDTCTAAGPIAPLGTCTVEVTFDPSSAGVKTATLRIPSDGTSTPHEVTLTGTGTVPDASIAPASLAFGSQVTTAGATATRQVTFSSTGGSPVTPASVSLAGADPTEFTIASNTCATGVPVATLGTCTVDVSFDPSAAGSKSALLRVASDAAASPHEVALSGTGTEPAPPPADPTPAQPAPPASFESYCAEMTNHICLRWKAPGSDVVRAELRYRLATETVDDFKFQEVPTTDTSYTLGVDEDEDILPGRTYIVILKFVDAAGQESNRHVTVDTAQLATNPSGGEDGVCGIEVEQDAEAQLTTVSWKYCGSEVPARVDVKLNAVCKKGSACFKASRPDQNGRLNRKRRTITLDTPEEIRRKQVTFIVNREGATAVVKIRPRYQRANRTAPGENMRVAFVSTY